ncbi:MAG: dipicolinate synthase subunit DpsA [Bacillota bacterium]
MDNSLSGIKIAVIGGDKRQLVLVKKLFELNGEIRVLGLPRCEETAGIIFCGNLQEAVNSVDAIVLPMPGTDNLGNVLAPLTGEKIIITKEIFQEIPSKAPIFVGVAKPFLREWARVFQKRLIEIADLDEIAIPNSIPTAEGCLQIAMEKLPITIHGSNAMVIGFGRCGKTLARMLNALGAKTTVFARKKADIARINEMGLNGETYDRLPGTIKAADVIFNTIPTQILDEAILKKLNKETLIIDIASAPGGTDFEAAGELGINAILAPSLPGLVAPKTAGLILAENLPVLILQQTSLSDKKESGGCENEI